MSDLVFIVTGMTDPVELIAEGVRGLIGQDPHSLPDSTLLNSTESIVRMMNQLSGVMAARLQVIDHHVTMPDSEFKPFVVGQHLPAGSAEDRRDRRAEHAI